MVKYGKKSISWAVPPSSKVHEYFGVVPEYGLTAEEGLLRREKWGSNLIKEKKRKGVVEIFLDQFKDFMVLVLLIATLISGLMGEYADALTIIVIVILNAALGFVQEYKVERSLEALKKLSATTGKVLRERRLKEIPAEEIVPGDVLYFQAGDRICADVRLFDSDDLMVDESLLTGESMAVEKEAVNINYLPSSPGDAINMVFNGTLVLNGSGKGIVVATGMHTEMGRIAKLIQEVGRENTPLQKRLARLGKMLIAACIALCLVVVFLGLWRGEDLYKMFLAGITLGVAAIPEGLPAIVTISLALGVQRMLKRKAIVRRLAAVETLGCATVICSDKTGTITENAMTVKSIYSGGYIWEIEEKGEIREGKSHGGKRRNKAAADNHLTKALTIAVLCNNSSLKKEGKNQETKGSLAGWEVQGNSTEEALLVCGAKAGIYKEKMENQYKRIKEYPFSSSRKCMSIIFSDGQNQFLYTKGAPERLLSASSHVLWQGEVRTLSEKVQQEIMLEIEKATARALRTIAVAYKPLTPGSGVPDADTVEKELIFVGFFSMMDPPRPEISQAVQICKRAGIKVIMVTGDHRNTAEAIACQTGILLPGGKVVTGAELDLMSDEELVDQVDKFCVLARVSPEHKLRIVRCLKARGHVVAMTGDGINDAPAIKEADIGIAMGKAGSEVTKEAADLVLADDNFSTIVAAVEEGRGIYDNIRKFIRFLLGCNTGEILTMLLAMLLGLPLPLRPIHILWVNLVTDGLPAMALGVDPLDADVMLRPPRPPEEGIMGRGLWMRVISRGAVIGVTTILVFSLSLDISANLLYAQTMALATLVVLQLFYVFECRSENFSPWEAGIFKNYLLLAAVILSFFLLSIILYHPFLRSVFYTYPIRAGDWFIIFTFFLVPHVIGLALRTRRRNIIAYELPMGEKRIK